MTDAKIDILAEKFRQRIKSGEFGNSGRIPPQRVIADQLNTTRETTNKIIQLLQSEGLLVVRDKSVYVRPLLIKLPAFIPNYDEYIKDRHLEPVSEFLEKPTLVPLPEFAANWMGSAEGRMAPHRLLRQGIRYPAGIVYYRLSENFYNPDLIKDEIFLDLQSDPQFDTWVAIKQKYGIDVVKANNLAFARLPTQQEQMHLEIVRGAPVLELCRAQIAKDGLVVMVNRLVFVGSLLELEFSTPVVK